MTKAQTSPIRVGLVGQGNVGQGVVDIFAKKYKYSERLLGFPIEIKTIAVKNLKKKRATQLKNVQLTADYHDILNDPEIDIVVELIGGVRPAHQVITGALKKGKYVVTANKELISKEYKTYRKLADEHDVDIFFEAAVGGGIPVISALKVGFAANHITNIMGILNGTTNYILSHIEKEKLPFDVVLKSAQDCGFAEADPHMDISGLDAAHKLVILAMVAFQADVSVSDVSYQGIKDITLKDMQYAADLGYRIKLLAVAKQESTKALSLSVYPTLVPLVHPLASVHNEYNAMFLHGDAVNKSMLYGKGAGSLPTASSVVADILEIIQTRIHATRYITEAPLKKVKVFTEKERKTQFYLRLLVKDSSGVLQKIATVFASHKVSILKLHQYDSNDQDDAELVIVTHIVKEASFQNALKELKSLREVSQICAVLHVI